MKRYTQRRLQNAANQRWQWPPSKDPANASTQSTYRAKYAPGGLLRVIPYTYIFALT